MEECQGTAYSRTNLQVKFSYQHPRYRIFILEEGNQPHPRFPQCDMFAPQEALNRVHPTSEIFRRRTERKRRRLLVEDTEEYMGRVLSAYDTPLTEVFYLYYLGKTFSSIDDDWPAVERNLCRAHGKWGKLENIFSCLGSKHGS